MSRAHGQDDSGERPSSIPGQSPTSDLTALQVPSMVLSQCIDQPWLDPVLSPLMEYFRTRRRQKRGYRDLLGWPLEALADFVHPSFFEGYHVTHGTLRDSGFHTFNRYGALQNYGGTMFHLMASAAVEGAGSVLNPVAVEFSKQVYMDLQPKLSASALWTSFTERASSNRNKAGLFVRDFLLRAHQAHDATTLHSRMRPARRTISNGGYEVSPVMHRVLFGRDARISYVLLQEARLALPDGGTKTVPGNTLLDAGTVQEISSGKFVDDPAWGIGEFDESGNCKRTLVAPRMYDRPATLYRDDVLDVQDFPERPDRRAFQVAGAIWAYEKAGAKSTMAVGGDKAPGSAVGAPLHPLFLEKLLANPENRKRFRDAVGAQPQSFVAALRFDFIDRPQEIPWRKRYRYPIYGHPAQSASYIGVHDLRHVKRITVEAVHALSQ